MISKIFSTIFNNKINSLFIPSHLKITFFRNIILSKNVFIYHFFCTVEEIDDINNNNDVLGNINEFPYEPPAKTKKLSSSFVKLVMNIHEQCTEISRINYRFYKYV